MFSRLHLISLITTMMLVTALVSAQTQPSKPITIAPILDLLLSDVSPSERLRQILFFTSTLNDTRVWGQRATTDVTLASGQTPSGHSWWRVSVDDHNSYLNQDIVRDASQLENREFQLSCFVRSANGQAASLGVNLLGGTTQGLVQLVVDTSTGNTTSFSDDNDFVPTRISDGQAATFVEAQSDGSWRIGFRFITAPQTNRLVVQIHRSQVGGGTKSADYSDCNLVEIQQNELAPFQYDEAGEPELTPSYFAGPFVTPLNPSVDAELRDAAAWDFELSDLANPVRYQIATPTELMNAVSQAATFLDRDHLIEITHNDWRGQGSVNFTQTADFFRAGGRLAITTLNRQPLLVNERWIVGNGLSGWGLFHFKTTHTENQYTGKRNGGAVYSSVQLGNGVRVLADVEFGTGDQADHDMMHCAVGIYANATDASTSTMVKRFKNRGTCSDWRIRGAQVWNLKDGYSDLQFEDSFYANANNRSADGKAVRVWKQNVFNGPLANTALSFLTINTSARDWTEDVYPFQLNEIVTQPSGFRARVTQVALGDGQSTSGLFGGARTIEGSGLGWRGDVVYLLAEPNSTSYLREGEVLTGQSSGASYTPQLTVKSGASSGFDSGMLLGLLHSDGHQWGANNDDVGVTYLFGTAGWFSVLSAPNGGNTQVFIHNNGTQTTHKLYSRYVYSASTAARAHPINNTDTVIEHSMFTRAPLGAPSERQLSDPGVSYDGSTLPSINIERDLQDTRYDQRVHNVISSSNAAPTSAISQGLAFPYLLDVKVARSDVAAIDERSYDSVFGTQLTRPYADQHVFEQLPVVPTNATREQAMGIIAGWFNYYREPIALGGWDLSVSQTGSGFPSPSIYGRNHSPGQVPVIKFDDYPLLVMARNQSFTSPSYTATDGQQDLSGQVQINTEDLDTSQVGDYIVEYSIANGDGNQTVAYLVVQVR